MKQVRINAHINLHLCIYASEHNKVDKSYPCLLMYPLHPDYHSSEQVHLHSTRLTSRRIEIRLTTSLCFALHKSISLSAGLCSEVRCTIAEIVELYSVEQDRGNCNYQSTIYPNAVHEKTVRTRTRLRSMSVEVVAGWS
jgi:hypothetical protein